MPWVLLLDERIKPDGSHARTFAEAIGGDHVEIRDDDGARGRLSLVAVDRVMCRYGRPLDENIVLDGEVLVLGAYRLRRLRHFASVDVEARDYLVWERPDGEPLACIATMVTAALRYLVLRLAPEPG